MSDDKRTLVGGANIAYDLIEGAKKAAKAVLSDDSDQISDSPKNLFALNVTETIDFPPEEPTIDNTKVDVRLIGYYETNSYSS